VAEKFRLADVDIIVPATRPTQLLRLLDQLDEQAMLSEVTVVDDSVGGHIERALEPRGLSVLISGGRGSGNARNLGVFSTRRPWILLMDDDIVVPPGFADRLLDVGSSLGSDVGLVECPIRPLGELRLPYWKCRVVENTSGGAFMTACLLVRRSAFEGVGGMMPGFGQPYREDTDFGVRVLSAGYRAIWTDKYEVLHPIEYINFRRFLKIAGFFIHDARFNRLHPGYLNQIGRRISVFGLRLGAFRRRIPLLGFACAAGLLLVPPVRFMAVLPVLMIGIALNFLHWSTLKRIGCQPSAARLFHPVEVGAHLLWGVILTYARARGEAEAVWQNVTDRFGRASSRQVQ
jgi:glycosyltransferase involved in cell wall biosynthesis